MESIPLSVQSLILVTLLALSGFFSASEMAYSSSNHMRLENAMEDGSKRAKAEKLGVQVISEADWLAIAAG